MPELPEVETIRRQLEPRLAGRSITAVRVIDPRWCEPVAPRRFERLLRGHVIRAVSRRGKYFVLELDGAGPFLLLHLRMTGNLLYANCEAAAKLSHLRAALALDDGHEILFVDPRRFGHATVLPDRASLDRYFADRLGPEPLADSFTPVALAEAVVGRTQPVKSLLLTQRRIAGIGNIYADEALFRARIHPRQPAGTLKSDELEALHRGIVEALTEGIDAKGASIDDFRDVDGVDGAMQDRFLVHRRAGEPCPACGGRIRRIVLGGRGTHFCPRCQKLRRRRKANRARQTSATRAFAA